MKTPVNPDHLWDILSGESVELDKAHLKLRVPHAMLMLWLRRLLARGYVALVYGYIVPTPFALKLVADWQKDYCTPKTGHRWPTLRELNAHGRDK